MLRPIDCGFGYRPKVVQYSIDDHAKDVKSVGKVFPILISHPHRTRTDIAVRSVSVAADTNTFQAGHAI